MTSFDYTSYEAYQGLIPKYFEDLRTIFKEERYSRHEIFPPVLFQRENPDQYIPSETVAVLSLWVKYQTMDGAAELMRYCCLDAKGYRISDQSARQFNWRVDAWLEKVRDIRKTRGSWFGM
jgi:hypothetical protein